MKRNHEHKRIIWKIVAAGLLLAVPLLVLPQTTHAALFGLLPDLSPGGITSAVFRVLAFIFNWIFGLLFILGGFLVNMAMGLNAQILNQQNALVGIGWTISRDVANLGFVLAMIIIAVATILRYESFSAKKLLPKLIAAAIIVNFSLTIAGVFITFSNSLTNVFLQGKLSGDMVSAIDNAFAPQKLLLPPENPPPPNPAEQGSAGGGLTATILTSIAGLVFTTLFTAIAALVMIALALMLLMRYIVLSLLLIAAPLAWLFWVFPSLQNLFHLWWRKFLDWVFFAPAVSFFIYIALASVQFLDSVKIPVSNGVGGGLETAFSQGSQMIVLAGVLIGGLMAAKSMSIAGASGALKVATNAGNKMKGWAKNYSTRVATAPLRSQPGRKLAEGMEKFGTKIKNPVLRTLAKPVTGYINTAGRAITAGGVTQGERLVKQASDSQKGTSDKQLAFAIHSLHGHELVAALSRLSKNGTLNLIPEGASTYINKGTESQFNAYGQDKAYGDMEKSIGLNAEMVKQLKAGNMDEFEKQTEKFIAKFSIKDFDSLKGNILSAFNEAENNLGLSETEHAAASTAIEHAVFSEAPGGIAKIRPKLKGGDLRKFNDELNTYISTIFEPEVHLDANLVVHNAPVKERIQWIDDNKPAYSAQARALYGAKKNMGGSLFGGGLMPGGGETTTEETT